MAPRFFSTGLLLCASSLLACSGLEVTAIPGPAQHIDVPGITDDADSPASEIEGTDENSGGDPGTPPVVAEPEPEPEPEPVTPPVPTGTVLWRSTHENLAANSTPPFGNGWENTSWNFVNGGGAAVLNDATKGRILGFYGPTASAQGSSVGAAQRAEQVPAGLVIQEGNEYWVGFDFAVQAGLAQSSTWNSAMQLRSSPTEGSPTISLDVQAHNNPGVEIGGARGSGAEPPHPLGTHPSGTWSRFVIGFYASSDPSLAWVEVWRDGVQVLTREPWRAVNDAGAKQVGGTLYAGDTTGYLKFGVYRGIQNFAVGYGMTNLRVGTTRGIVE